ncbi:MAG: class I SAM-dependent methyltransferase [Gaiellales bacterium]
MGLADSISRRSRRHKLDLFLKTFTPDSKTTVLDVGAADAGYGDAADFATYNFLEEFYPWPERITAVGLGEGARFAERYPRTPYVRADGCDLPFPSGAFDLYHSNAVIEHLDDRQRQERLVDEALRVARQVFITTPNRRFPLEVHTRLPIVHWLPQAAAHQCYRWARKPWATELRPLTTRELASLFPAHANVRVANLGLTLVAITRA